MGLVLGLHVLGLHVGQTGCWVPKPGWWGQLQEVLPTPVTDLPVSLSPGRSQQDLCT